MQNKLNNFIEENTQNSHMHQGVFIDIMCLNNVSDNQVYRFGQYVSALLLTAQTIDKRGYAYNTSFKIVCSSYNDFIIHNLTTFQVLFTKICFFN